MELEDLLGAVRHRRDVSIMELRRRFGEDALPEIQKLFKKHLGVNLGIVYRVGSVLLENYPDDEGILGSWEKHAVGGYVLTK